MGLDVIFSFETSSFFHIIGLFTNNRLFSPEIWKHISFRRVPMVPSVGNFLKQNMEIKECATTGQIQGIIQPVRGNRRS
jgi:hypothetical protein